ncbi:hypothetical protein CVIRNUC_004594 [Coccomyxa viridis]|uniref:Uncharacterized protein n=2 Tax=Coccomyxa viridis TaxID=1274662 RepID=A0AAV1I2Y0_9CHLO|nr:hypothetical protein CVIRNUC_004594 [Coccomyxa viridis]
MQPRHYLFAACVFVITLSVLILTSRSDVAEPFSVVGGSVDTRLALLGSTDHSANTKGTWIKVATFVNSAANQSHALTLEIYPNSESAGGSRQTVFVLAQNTGTGPDSAPIVVQKNTWDSSNWATPTIITASLVLTQSASSTLTNQYDLYLQLGVPNATGIPANWILSKFNTSDIVALGDVTPVTAVPTGTATYAAPSSSAPASSAVATTGPAINPTPLTAYWQQSGAVSAPANTPPKLTPAFWTLLSSVSSIPAGVTIMNASGGIVIPYRGIYAMTLGWDPGSVGGVEQMWFDWSGSGSGRLGAAQISANQYTVTTCSYTGPLAAGDVLTPTLYFTAATNIAASSPPSPYITMSISLLQRF